MSDLQGTQMSLTKNFHYPPAHQDDVIETYHGTAIADPYRWLEDPDSAETQAWVAAQNELTQSFLAELTSRPQIEQRLTSLWDYPKYSTPEERHGRTQRCSSTFNLSSTLPLSFATTSPPAS